MSGEAGAGIAGPLYSIFVGSGIRVDVAINPEGDGNDVAEYFERHNAPFTDWLERAKPELDALFARSTLPLAPLDQPYEQIFVDGGDHLGDYRSLHLNLCVKERVPPAALTELVKEVAAILKAH